MAFAMQTGLNVVKPFDNFTLLCRCRNEFDPLYDTWEGYTAHLKNTLTISHHKFLVAAPMQEWETMTSSEGARQGNKKYAKQTKFQVSWQ